jgi:RNA 3'-terminal phosphate cyclase
VDSFEELPGVGIGGGDRTNSLLWVALLVGTILSVTGIRLARLRPGRRRL